MCVSNRYTIKFNYIKNRLIQYQNSTDIELKRSTKLMLIINLIKINIAILNYRNYEYMQKKKREGYLTSIFSGAKWLCLLKWMHKAQAQFQHWINSKLIGYIHRNSSAKSQILFAVIKWLNRTTDTIQV